MKIKVTPVGAKVTVKQFEADETTTGGIVLPNTVRSINRPKTGKVLEVGPDVKAKVKKGDTVAFAMNGAAVVEVEKEEYLVMHEDHILAVLEMK